MKIERRDFLKLVGGLSGAVVVGGAGFAGIDQVFDVPEELIEKARLGPGIESWKATVCGQCPGGCGLLVRSIDGIPVYVKGNPLHPVNQGGMCPLGHSSLELLFNPDRLKKPVERIGTKGSGKWQEVDWDYALERVSGALSELRASSRPHHVTFLGGGERGLMRDHVGRFMRTYGSPNYYQVPDKYSSRTACRLATGRDQEPAADLAHANLIVSFGSNFLEEGQSPVYFTKLYSRLRGDFGARRIRFIQIEPRLSLTAANADHWVPILPGTYGALALGIAHVLIREELYDDSFVRRHTFGFDAWRDQDGNEHVGFKALVLSEYYPERVSEITGVPSARILNIARELGNTRPAVVVQGEGVSATSNGTYAQMAVLSLNALLGNLGRDGGVVFPGPPPFTGYEDIPVDEVARDGLAQHALAPGRANTLPVEDYSIADLASSLKSGLPYPTEILFTYRCNPLFTLPGHGELREALERIPLVVSFDSFVSETSEYADLILPEHTFLEHWDLISEVDGVAFGHAAVQQPVIDPIYDTRSTADVLIGLVSKVGAEAETVYPESSYQNIVKSRLTGIYESGQGAVASEGLGESWLEFMQQRGWQIGRYSSFDSFWNELLDKGGWWNPVREEVRPEDLFLTPTGKYEFYPMALKAPVDAAYLGVLPHHESLDAADDKPFRLISFEMLPNRSGAAANLPMMQEMFGYQVRHYWTTWVELNPVTAASLGISDGDLVWVESVVGSIRVTARVVPGIAPDVVAVPFGLGHTSYGRYAAGHGANPHSIMTAAYDSITRLPSLHETKVSLTPTT